MSVTCHPHVCHVPPACLQQFFTNTSQRFFSGLTDSDVFAVRAFSLTDQDWFGNVRAESFSNKYIVRLSGVQLSNCPYAEELTLRDVLCKCPNLYFGRMDNCTHGGSLKSINMDSSLKARYFRGDTTGRRAAPNDEFNKGPTTRLVHNATDCVFPHTLRSLKHSRRQGVLQVMAGQHHDLLPRA
jgi:hypothetical protein